MAAALDDKGKSFLVPRGDLLPRAERTGDLRRAILLAAFGHALALLVVLPSYDLDWKQGGKSIQIPVLRRWTPEPVREARVSLQTEVEPVAVALPSAEVAIEPRRDRRQDYEVPVPGTREFGRPSTILWGPRTDPPEQGSEATRVSESSLKVLKKVPAKYPILAKRAELEGVVVLDVLVNERGRVAELEVLKALPMGLTQSAVEAVRQWEFEPTRRHGRAVPALMRVRVEFSLE